MLPHFAKSRIGSTMTTTGSGPPTAGRARRLDRREGGGDQSLGNGQGMSWGVPQEAHPRPTPFRGGRAAMRVASHSPTADPGPKTAAPASVDDLRIAVPRPRPWPFLSLKRRRRKKAGVSWGRGRTYTCCQGLCVIRVLIDCEPRLIRRHPGLIKHLQSMERSSWVRGSRGRSTEVAQDLVGAWAHIFRKRIESGAFPRLEKCYHN